MRALPVLPSESVPRLCVRPAGGVRRPHPDEGERLLTAGAAPREDGRDALRLVGCGGLDGHAAEMHAVGVQPLVVHRLSVVPEEERPRAAGGIGAREQVHHRGIATLDLGAHPQGIDELARRRAERLIPVAAHAIEDEPGGEIRRFAGVVRGLPAIACHLHVERRRIGGDGGGGIGPGGHESRRAAAARETRQARREEQRGREACHRKTRYDVRAATGPSAHFPAFGMVSRPAARGRVARRAGGVCAAAGAGCLPIVGSSSRSIQSLITQRPLFTSR